MRMVIKRYLILQSSTSWKRNSRVLICMKLSKILNMLSLLQVWRAYLSSVCNWVHTFPWVLKVILDIFNYRLTRGRAVGHHFKAELHGGSLGLAGQGVSSLHISLHLKDTDPSTTVYPRQTDSSSQIKVSTPLLFLASHDLSYFRNCACYKFHFNVLGHIFWGIFKGKRLHYTMWCLGL